MKIVSTQHTHSHQSANTPERHVYEALPLSERRQRTATSAYLSARTHGFCQSRELDNWLQADAGRDQQRAD
ncbi:hypothetical protein HUU62_16145 [Rhodoferax sp. 4810]|nr:hypothetical protein [Rhodoferax jenense]